MALLNEVSSRQYNPNQRPEVTLAVNPGATIITITITRGDWPEGPCLEYDILWGGVPDGSTIIGGGVVRDKAGNPTGGTMQVTRTSRVRPHRQHSRSRRSLPHGTLALRPAT